MTRDGFEKLYPELYRLWFYAPIPLDMGNSLDWLRFAEYVRKTHSDNPDLDGTDFAHPAWVRGNDHGLAVVCQKVNAILDGTDSNGIASEPWQSLRQRLYDIRTLLGLAKRVITRMPYDCMGRFATTIVQWYKVRNDYTRRVGKSAARS